MNYKPSKIEYQLPLEMENVIEIVSLKQEIMERPTTYSTRLDSTAGAGNFGRDQIADYASEVLLVVALNAKYEINAVSKVFKGSLNMAISHPREIYQMALLNNAHSIMIFHNHPSGHPQPSESDIDTTQRLIEVGQMIGIPLLDHIIVTPDDYVSLRAEGHF